MRERDSEVLIQLTRQSLCDVVQADLRLIPQQSVHGHHHPRRTEAALRAVSLGDALLPTQHPGQGGGQWGERREGGTGGSGW